MAKDLPGVVVAPGDIEEFVDGVFGENKAKNMAAYRRIVAAGLAGGTIGYASSKKKKKKKRK